MKGVLVSFPEEAFASIIGLIANTAANKPIVKPTLVLKNSSILDNNLRET